MKKAISKESSDPYLAVDACIQRLMDEYRKHPKLIIACDYDDTVFDFNQRGQTHQKVIDVLRRCNRVGFYVVLFTASDPSRFDEMKAYLAEQSVIVDAVNENPIVLKFGNHRKIYFNILLDDRAGLGQALETLSSVLAKVEAEKKL